MSGINAMDNTVIACVDGSSSTRAVCEYAAWIAGKLDVPLALLHVLEKNEQPAVSDLTGTIGIDSREQLTQDLVRIPAEVNPRNTGILEQEQNGVTAPKQEPSKYPIPRCLPAR